MESRAEVGRQAPTRPNGQPSRHLAGPVLNGSLQSNGTPVVAVKKRSVNDFVMGDCIGEGSYSRVFRAVSKTNKKMYAIKVLNKQHIHQEQKRKYVTIEKDTLNLLGQHDGIVTLYYTFQDSRRLYFVIDYASNGELLGLILKYGSLSERVVRYYAMQLVDTLAFIHSKGVIHRDLKPENILLNGEWKVMVTDFGAAKVVDEQDPNTADGAADEDSRKGSFVGTAEYVTPELLERNECGTPSDFWALGCILYQMVLGRPPFKEASEYDTFLKIINLDYTFPKDCPLPKAMENIISGLLRAEPDQRFGIEEVQKHAWFRGVKWGDWRAVWGQRAPKFEPYDPSPLMVLSEVGGRQGLNLRREIDNGRTNRRLMDKMAKNGTMNSESGSSTRTVHDRIDGSVSNTSSVVTGVNGPSKASGASVVIGRRGNGAVPVANPLAPWPRKSPISPSSPSTTTYLTAKPGTPPTSSNQVFVPPQRKVSSDAISAAGAVGSLMGHRTPPQTPLVNPVLLDREVPRVIREKLLMGERILKLDNILKSELGFKPNQFVVRGEPLTDEVLQGVIKRNEYSLERSLRVCILVITSFARLLIYELDSGTGGVLNHNSLTMMHVRNFYSHVTEVKLTNPLVSLYDYEFDEDTKDGYLILELNNVNKLIFLRNWDRSTLVKGGLNLNVRVGFTQGENESWVGALLKAKNMLKKN